MDEIGAPLGKVVVVGFAAYVVGSAFKLDALKVRRARIGKSKPPCRRIGRYACGYGDLQ